MAVPLQSSDVTFANEALTHDVHQGRSSNRNKMIMFRVGIRVYYGHGQCENGY